MTWDGNERRGRVRVSLPCRIIIYTPQAETIDTIINNICEGGVGLTLMKQLEDSSQVELKVYGVKEEAIICKGIVRWVKSIESSQRKGVYFFNTGIQFSEINENDVLAIRNLVASKTSD